MPSVLRDSVSPSGCWCWLGEKWSRFTLQGSGGCLLVPRSLRLSRHATEALTWPQTGVCPLSPFPSGAAVGRSHSPPEAPPTPRPGPWRRAAALGPGGRGLRRGLGGRSSADPGSRLPAPCEGLGGRGGGRSLAERGAARGALGGRGGMVAAAGRPRPAPGCLHPETPGRAPEGTAGCRLPRRPLCPAGRAGRRPRGRGRAGAGLSPRDPAPRNRGLPSPSRGCAHAARGRPDPASKAPRAEGRAWPPPQLGARSSALAPTRASLSGLACSLVPSRVLGARGGPWPLAASGVLRGHPSGSAPKTSCK
ncbi:Hypothetical predicted protein [Marmota monax]|uniref:Uncharacterized protein n=1 Tax=Marmota monax TaxID=9995 RepID=A0A5E4APV7_MARMO|nr:Hypothetical predicted protein [Marmota monax]